MLFNSAFYKNWTTKKCGSKSIVLGLWHSYDCHKFASECVWKTKSRKTAVNIDRSSHTGTFVSHRHTHTYIVHGICVCRPHFCVYFRRLKNTRRNKHLESAVLAKALKFTLYWTKLSLTGHLEAKRMAIVLRSNCNSRFACPAHSVIECERNLFSDSAVMHLTRFFREIMCVSCACRLVCVALREKRMRIWLMPSVTTLAWLFAPPQNDVMA